jgi:hypothetical protein
VTYHAIAFIAYGRVTKVELKSSLAHRGRALAAVLKPQRGPE